ncbi:hypothetical protein JCM10449v2_006833 [Rhodotorula kratochvilovae]
MPAPTPSPPPPSSRPTSSSSPSSPRPPRVSRPSPQRIFLLSFLTALAAFLILRLALAPPAWASSASAAVRRHWHGDGDGEGNDARVLRSRPGLRGVERYDHKHRYRPAASPVVEVLGPDGNKRERGRYY